MIRGERRLKLNVYSKIEKFLIENRIIDERKIWCYAHMKAKMKFIEEPVEIYGLTLVCVNQEELFLYGTEVNSTDLKLVWKTHISEIENISTKKIFFGLRTKLFFSKGVENFEFEMSEWKRFEAIFQEK